ncbi:MAG: hypothetical protein EBY26_05120 [Microbacteriaceae bacterium]|nr:hypothetical protein [Microbacteriaceae bacterium]
MKNNWRKITAMVATAAFATLGISAVSPADAADPYVGAKISLVSPVLTALNTSEAEKNQAMADGWVRNTWFGSGLIYQRSWLPVGSTFKLTYHVTDDKNKPLVGQTVILRCNKQYSVSTAQIKCNGQMIKAATGQADGGRVAAVTDAYGNVTFTVQNLDTEGEVQPAKWTDAPVISEDGLDDFHAQFLPQIAGEKPDHSVITEFHFYVPTVTDPAMPEVFPVIPTALRAPAMVSGTAKVGSTLTAATGFFTGNPEPTKTYIWGRCSVAGKTELTVSKPPASAKCVAIAGKTKSTYKLVAADKGKFIRVAVTASNTAGTAYSISKTTTVVK